MRALAAEGAFVRLCKGAYKEPADRAFPKKAAVDANFVRLTELFLSEEARAAGAFLAIATHDEKMIAAAKAYVRAHDVPPDSFEFQMLYGIRPNLQAQLRDDGFTMRLYAGYETEWYPYFMRRLAERRPTCGSSPATSSAADPGPAFRGRNCRLRSRATPCAVKSLSPVCSEITGAIS